MAVNDHGLEVLKKSGEEVVAGNPSNMFLKVSGAGQFETPVGADAITALYPNSITEVFQYRRGGIAGTILKTFTVIYTNSTKELISSVAVT